MRVNLNTAWFAPDATLYLPVKNPHSFPDDWKEHLPDGAELLDTNDEPVIPKPGMGTTDIENLTGIVPAQITGSKEAFPETDLSQISGKDLDDLAAKENVTFDSKVKSDDDKRAVIQASRDKADQSAVNKAGSQN